MCIVTTGPVRARNSIAEGIPLKSFAPVLAVVLALASPAFASVTVASPSNNATVTSPVQFVASASTGCGSGVASIGIYVNNQLEFVANGASLNTALPLDPGAYYVVIQEWDYCGGATTTPLNITVAKSGSSGVTVSSPANGSTVTSPVKYVAGATSACAAGVAAMGIYVNGQLAYTVNGSSLNTSLTLSPGTYNTVVQEWDNCGNAATTPINLTVTSSSGSPGVSVSEPSNSSSVTSPVHYVATATSSCAQGVASMGIYVDNQLDYVVNGSSLNTELTLNPGTYNTVVQEWDNCGKSATTPIDLTVTGSSFTPGTASVTTWHYDKNRSGNNPDETSLTPSNVNSQSFGKLFSYLVDGYVYGEPLLVSNLTINGAKHNVVYVATENDSVYAFDADSYGSGTPLWETSLLRSGESPITTGPIQPVEGVTSTPVIDPSTNTIYIVSAQQVGGSAATFRLNALDITTGAQKFGGPVTIQASVPGTNQDSVNGVVSLTTACIQRAALLLANGNVYMGFGGCHSGWLLAYSASTLAQVGVFNASPNVNGEGTYASAGGVWMGSGGPVADSSGNVYITTGNGPWDGRTAYGDSVLKFGPALKLKDYFTPDDYQFMDCSDSDLAAGGLLLIPGTNELLAGGKSGKLYLVNSTSMGHEQANDAGATQTLWYESDLWSPYSASCTDSSGTHTTDINSYEIFGTSAYYNNYVYLGITPTAADITAGVRQFEYSGTLTPGAYTSPSIQENTRGTTPFISSHGTQDGIVWMIDTGQPIQNGVTTPSSAKLRAYDAAEFPNELYNSSQNSADTPGYGIKFTSPVVANGKVYISTGHDLSTATNPQGEIDVYGLK
jgi:hypothetical protein